MASSGKKGKKSKGKTVSLTDFLSTGSANGGPDTTTVLMPSASWADEMDEDDRDSRGGYGNSAEKFVLPTAPRAARGPDMSDERIPKDPPFTAYIANLSYDVDTEVVMQFFGKLKIKGVRLPRDGDAETGRLKGFGYADFEDRESLVEALNMNDHLLQNRKIRVDLATHAGRGNERGGFNDRGGGGRYNNRDNDDEDRTAGDWRSGPPPPPRDNDRDRGYDRGGDRRGGDRDGSRGFDRYEPPRERGGYDRDDRRDGNRGYGFGRDDRDRGYGGDRRGYGGDRSDDRFNRDDRRDRGGFDRYERRDDRRRSPEPPKERPRLKLLPKQAEKTDSGEEKEGAGKSSIFGSAKPVDTAKKEAEIDQKLQETQTRVRTIDLASKRRDEEERQKAERRDSEKENDSEKSKPKGASIFGAAKPVDTSTREKEIEERLKKQNDSKLPRNVDRRSKDDDRSETRSPEGRALSHDSSNRSCDEEERKPDIKKPASSDIFGSAKPVDTTTREREIEEKLKKSRAGNTDNQNTGRRDDRGDQSNRNRPNRGGDRNYDRRDDGRDRRRDDRRDGDRNQSSRDNRQDGRKQGHEETRRNKSPPPMKKVDETKAPNFVGSNKFQFLQDDEVGSGKGSDSE